LSEVLERVIYEPEIFPAAIYYMDRPRLTMLIFQNGKTIIAGAKVRGRDSGSISEDINNTRVY
jgi:TATA-box binding protein (TBP) (component of TFIID and TFIIIB)